MRVERGAVAWKDYVGRYVKFGEFSCISQDGLVLEERVAPEGVCWAARLKNHSLLGVGWSVDAVEKGKEPGQAE